MGVFVLEDGTGVEEANAYLDVAFAREYFDADGRLSTWNGTSITKAVTAVDATTEQLTVVDYDYRVGDGPLTISGGTVPTGLVAGTEYWVGAVDPATKKIKLSSSYANAIATVPVIVDITAIGAGSRVLTHPDFVALRQRIVKATTYVERRWGELFVGNKGTDEQGLHFPATNFYRVVQGAAIEEDGVPRKFKEAVAELALIAASVDDLVASGPAVTSETRSKGGVTRSVTYAQATVSGGGETYTEVVRMMRPFLRPLRAVRA